MKTKVIMTLVAVFMQLTAFAQHSPDFAEKFMSIYNNDSTLACVTISPKMMMQLVKKNDEKECDEKRPENILQAISKLKSARIVTGKADYYEKAEQLLIKNNKRFQSGQDYQTEEQRGAFYTRKDKKGQTVELIMLYAEPEKKLFTIINLTGDIDEEFLCFLYNNKTFKN
jgi:hypothetical protein